MAGTLGSYNTAVSGMDVARRGLAVTGHNLANVNSVGYTRQQSISKDKSYDNMGVTFYGDFQQNRQVGTGTDHQEIRQIRNQFLDISYRNESTKFGYYDTKQKAIAEIESLFKESEDTGLQYVINQFYNALHEVEKDPSGLAARGLLKNRAMEFAATVNYMYTQLENKQQELNLQIVDKVDQVNQFAAQITELNQKIKEAEQAGDQANDLRDDRNIVLDSLSKLIKIHITESEQDGVTVLFGNSTLVRGSYANKLTTTIFSDSEGGSDKLGYFVYPTWEYNQKEPITFEGGQIAALLETRGTFVDNQFVTGATNQWKNGSLEMDASGSINQPQKDIEEFGLIPNLKRQLNVLVNTMAEGINNVMTQCFDLRGNTGKALFTTKNGMGVIQANNIDFNSAEILDLDMIAISKTGDKGDGTGAFDIINLRRKTDGVTFQRNDGVYNYTYDDFYSVLFSDLGNAGQQVNRAAQSQNDLMNQLSNERTRISGVSEDEEMQRMLTYQHAYNASARVFNAIDDMVDRIVNQLKR